MAKKSIDLTGTSGKTYDLEKISNEQIICSCNEIILKILKQQRKIL